MRGSDVRLWSVLALMAAVPLLAGCMSISNLDRLPFARTETESLPGAFAPLGPLFEVQWKDSVVEWNIRPFVSVRQYYRIPTDEHADYKVPHFGPLAIMPPHVRETPPLAELGEPSKSALQVYALYPLYKHESCGEQSRTFFYPFYYNVRDVDSSGERWHHWGFFPFYFAGETDADGPYSAVFPFYGTLKNWLGRDRIEFIMFPFYSHSTTDEHESYNYLWPIVNFTYGGGRDSWSVWPFVGRSKRHDEPPVWYFLWPLFWYTEDPEAGEEDSHSFAFFPLFGWQKKGDTETTNIVWPIYSHAKNEKTGRTDTVIVWFLVRTGDGPDYHRRQVWPFYGYHKEDDTTRSYVMWPFYRRKWVETDTRYMSGWSMLLYRSIYNEWIGSSGIIRNDFESVLWPFYYYKRDGLGNTYFSLLNLRGVPDPQGFDRFYSFLWTLFEKESRTDWPGPPDNVWRSTRALWGLYRHDRDRIASRFRVFPFVSTTREADRRTSLQILLGLFGYADEPGERTYKVLYIPWTVSREEEP